MGFNYYSVDTDRYQDIKIKRLKKELGCSALSVYDYMLCEIYRVRGCYLEWDENVNFDIAEYLQESEEFVSNVLDKCMKIGLFDITTFKKFNVVTSKSIQERYLEMCQRSKRKEKSIPEMYNILKAPVIIPDEIDNVPEETTNTQEEVTPENKANSIKDEFESFRVRYPGSKRGLTTEFENFKKKHKDFKEVVSLLSPALEELINWRQQKKLAGQFVPEYANLSTWINQRRWEVELETIQHGDDKKQITAASTNNQEYASAIAEGLSRGLQERNQHLQ